MAGSVRDEQTIQEETGISYTEGDRLRFPYCTDSIVIVRLQYWKYENETICYGILRAFWGVSCGGGVGVRASRYG